MSGYSPPVDFANEVLTPPFVDSTRDDMLMRGSGFHTDKTITLSANNTTAQENIFQVTGAVEIIKIRAELKDTTTFTNCTAMSLQLWDGSAAVQLTSSGGSAMSGFVVGSLLAKTGKAANAISVADASAGFMIESASDKETYDQFIVGQKLSTSTFIRLQYTTTDAPINAQLEFHVEWRPIDGGTIVAV